MLLNEIATDLVDSIESTLEVKVMYEPGVSGEDNLSIQSYIDHVWDESPTPNDRLRLLAGLLIQLSSRPRRMDYLRVVPGYCQGTGP